MATRDNKRILSVRLRHPSGDGELEVRFESAECDDVDAVFTSVDAVKKLLIPFYEQKDRKDAEAFLREVEEQEQGGVCIVLHKLSCRRLVPRIDWTAKSTPIRL